LSYIDPQAETVFFARQKEIMRRLGVTTPRVFDVGANVGQSIGTYRALFPGCPITSFEPVPDCFKELSRKHGAEPGVRLENLALSDSPGRRPFYVTRCREASSLLMPDETVRKKSSKGNYDYDPIEAEVDTLDAWCARTGADAIDILKIDVQGAELGVMRGAAGLLAASKVRMMYVEVIFADNYQSQSSLVPVASYLETHRYVLWDVRPFLFTRAGRLWTANAMFMSAPSAALLESFPEEFPV
jgi:FkbM family methyltransferase